MADAIDHVTLNNLNFIKNNNKVKVNENSLFSENLSNALKKDKLDKEKTVKTKLKNLKDKNLLNVLHEFNAPNINFSNKDIQTIASASNKSFEEIQDSLTHLRKNLMSDIKNSLQKLEKEVKNPDNKVPEDLLKKFLKAIDEIKIDFTQGFGEKFEDFTYNRNKMIDYESTISDIFNNANKIPKNIVQKLEQIL